MNRTSLRLAAAGVGAAALVAVGAALAGPALAGPAGEAPPRASTAAVQQPAPDDAPGRPDRDCPEGAGSGDAATPAPPTTGAGL